jgi:thiamine-monophosphate kinase
VSLADYDKVKNHPDITIIGKVTNKSEGINLANKHGQSFPLQAQGWKHF